MMTLRKKACMSSVSKILTAYLLAEPSVGRLRVRLLGAIAAPSCSAAVTATTAKAASAAPCKTQRRSKINWH